MDKRHEMIAGAARVFEQEGFRGIGIDRVLASVGASTRTLYKHFGSRDGLVLAVLDARHRAFMAELGQAPKDGNEQGHPVAAFFDTLKAWTDRHGARGCMLLRARAEYGAANKDIVALSGRQKQEYRIEVARRVQAVLGRVDARLATQVWLLLEGAAAGASVAGVSVIDDAREAALLLLALAGRRVP